MKKIKETIVTIKRELKSIGAYRFAKRCGLLVLTSFAGYGVNYIDDFTHAAVYGLGVTMLVTVQLIYIYKEYRGLMYIYSGMDDIEG